MDVDITRPWKHLVATYDPYTLDILGQIGLQLVFWWIPCIILMSLDTIAPAFSERHKIQPAPKQPTRSEIWTAVGISARNQILATIIHIGLVYGSYAAGRPSPFRVDAELPTLAEFVRDFIICALGREFLFYYVHRTFHSRWLYQRIHKLHHQFTAPVGFASQFAHPLEHVLANMLPLALPPMLIRTHMLTMWVYLAYQLLETVFVHSGYDFLLGAARMHDRHHERFNVYFGDIGILDWVHGTGEKGGIKGGKKRE